MGANASLPSAPSPDSLRLGSFTYDPTAASHIQTFPVNPMIADLGIDMGVVIFRIESNWGGDFTCLYRVSILILAPLTQKHPAGIEPWLTSGPRAWRGGLGRAGRVGRVGSEADENQSADNTRSETVSVTRLPLILNQSSCHGRAIATNV